ncbi:hypothetical protein [Nocardioides sp. SR21]|uniref:hypothetical protein n=1 Tax=Nocardioides sp. SR21 TaxID=2919501 RepID=UPI001FAAC74A|nr:hypothetical protein [Nocardioides sp. SR21]
MTEGEHEELRASSPNSAGPQTGTGDMGVSSERVGHTGPGQVGTDGQKDTSPKQTPQHRKGDEDTPPEQSPGNVEENPVGIPPKAGYPSKDPRSDDEV